MSIKQLLFRDEARARILRGVDTLAEAVHPMDLKRGMEQGVEAVVDELHRLARPCASLQEIEHVAAISANNDR